MVQGSARNRHNHRQSRPPSVALRKRRHSSFVPKKGRRAGNKRDNAYQPPEDWYEPQDDCCGDYRIIEQAPGDGYRHVVTPDQIRDRLGRLPEQLVMPLEVVQLSRMTRKKKAFPCYGMQWGNAIYLYPLEEEFVEYFNRPPRPSEYNETRQFGGQWSHEGGRIWRLTWTEAALQDLFLNNVLIHELGHLLDKRNSSYRDRERYAEWFAIEHGFRPSRERV